MKVKHSQFCPILILLVFSFVILPSTAEIAVYWEMYGRDGPSLRQSCESGLYQYVIATFPTPGSNLGAKDEPSSSDITYCQTLGVKVLISLGGRIGLRHSSSSSISDLEKEAKESAYVLWTMFLSGSDENVVRPYGDAIFDGVDFNKFGLPRPDDRQMFYYYLALALKNYSTPERKVYLSASPHCVFPDPDLDLPIRVGKFDFVSIQFYNNPKCDYSGGVENVLSAWNEWEPWVSRAGSQLFMSLPASTNPWTFSGYIPPDVLVDQILPVIKQSPAYGGVTVFSLYFDQISGYTRIISPFVTKQQPSISQVV